MANGQVGVLARARKRERERERETNVRSEEEEGGIRDLMFFVTITDGFSVSNDLIKRFISLTTNYR